MDWIAASVALACLILLAADLGRRWGRPRLYVSPRRPLTYVVLAVIVTALVIVNVVD